MRVECQAVGPFFKNGYVVSCDTTREAVLIDPGDEVESLLAYARREQLDIRFVLLTHAHVDHVTGVAQAKRVLGTPIYLHRDDLFLYERAAEQGAMFGLPVQPLPPIDEFYSPGQVIPFGLCDARPHHTPGHCPGGVCLQLGTARRARTGSLRRRHPLRGFDRADRSTGRPLPNSHQFNPEGALLV